MATNQYDNGGHEYNPAFEAPSNGPAGSGNTYDSNGNVITPPSGNQSGGGSGGGLPFGGGGGAATATGVLSGYTGMTTMQEIQAAIALYQAYRGSQPGQFQQIPEDPSQTAARAKLLGFVDSSPTRDLLGNLIGQRLGAAHGFQLPPGANGYNPTPSGSAAGGYDLSRILPTLMGHSAPASNPAVATADPAAISQWLGQHPEVLKMGAQVAAGSVAQVFGVPTDQAAQIIIQYLRSQRGPVGPAAATPGTVMP